ncbi:HAD-like domain-containing protein [Cercophora samala]|uniref:HAD-like domain-containing protein n=1 Tax=Cercophora samala TaxID=330535 RepID=A0AA40DCM6_9PEZI|nr:HAD-like domain-containing protein [Cercophora samala]
MSSNSLNGEVHWQYCIVFGGNVRLKDWPAVSQSGFGACENLVRGGNKIHDTAIPDLNLKKLWHDPNRHSLQPDISKMTVPSRNVPHVRACIFDLDGLLLNTEDIYSICANTVLSRYSRPPISWSLKAQLMGVPGSSNGETFHQWAKLPISREQYKAEQQTEQDKMFPMCEALPGAKQLLERLSKATTEVDGRKIQVALASSSVTSNLKLKTSRREISEMIGLIPEKNRVLSDHDKMKGKRGKPAPDIFLTALAVINELLDTSEGKIRPEECLVFEDSVPGVEAARRAGMRVVWVPHPELCRHWAARETEVLAGTTGLVKLDGLEKMDPSGKATDGWGEKIGTLEEFEYGKYGIRLQSSDALGSKI